MKNLILIVFITLTNISTPTKADLKIDACLIEGLSTFPWQTGTTAATIKDVTAVHLINKDVFHVLETQVQVEAKIVAANPNRENCVIDIPGPQPLPKEIK